MSQLDSGLITLASIEAIQKHTELEIAVLEANQQRVKCQTQLREQLDAKSIDHSESWRIPKGGDKIESILEKILKTDMLYKNFHDASVVFHKSVTEAAIVHAELMKTINVSETDLMQTKSFWIRRLSLFIERRNGFDEFCKEYEGGRLSIINQGKKEIRAEILELSEHFKWAPELEVFFTIV